MEDVWVAGSLATGDHAPGVSDIDLVAIVEGPVDAARRAKIAELHAELDRGAARGAALGCVYVEEWRLLDLAARHPTWTHGLLVVRILSGIRRVELVTGRDPTTLLRAASEADVREAVRAELAGYWLWAARRPHLFLASGMVDLGLTSMARARHGLRHGDLITKTEALAHVRAPARLLDQLRSRRQGQPVRSPRFRSAWAAWGDVRRTLQESGLSRNGPHA